MAKISDLGDPLGVLPQKGEYVHSGHICTIPQNFTPISATVTEIAVTGHSKKYTKQYTLPHSVWQVTNCDTKGGKTSV